MVAGALLLIAVVSNVGALGVLETPPDEPEPRSAWRSAAELDLQPDGGSLSVVSLPLVPGVEVLKWTAAVGESLRLRLTPVPSGPYAPALRVVSSAAAPTISIALWDTPLLSRGLLTLDLATGEGMAVRDVRFAPVPVGPGHHELVLCCVEPGDLHLVAVALQPTDEPATRADEGLGGRPFLGVQLGTGTPDGVPITRIVEGGAAGEAGLREGDVIVGVDGTPVRERPEVMAAILLHCAGEPIDLAVSRDGEPIDATAMLSRRATADRGSERAAHVIDVLAVAPGHAVADIGCGTAWLSESIADVVGLDGADGVVYAVEIDPERIRALHRWRIPHVVPVLSVPDDVCLPENSLDIAMLHDVASHVHRSARPRFYESVQRALRPDATLVVFGPHGRGRAMLDDLARHGFAAVNDAELRALDDPDLDAVLWEGIVFRFDAERVERRPRRPARLAPGAVSLAK